MGLAEEVSKGARPGGIHCFVVDRLDQYPIRLNVTVAEALPVSSQRVITMARREVTAKPECFDDGPERLQIHPSLSKPLQVALERRAGDDDTR
jgi:hypothetical protein